MPTQERAQKRQKQQPRKDYTRPKLIKRQKLAQVTEGVVMET